MELLHITEALYIDNYRVNLSFNNGFKGIVDLKNKVFSDHRSIFTALQDKSFFKKFKLNSWTIEWENGLDLAPEFLHELALNK